MSRGDLVNAAEGGRLLKDPLATQHLRKEASVEQLEKTVLQDAVHDPPPVDAPLRVLVQEAGRPAQEHLVAPKLLDAAVEHVGSHFSWRRRPPLLRRSLRDAARVLPLSTLRLATAPFFCAAHLSAYRWSTLRLATALLLLLRGTPRLRTALLLFLESTLRLTTPLLLLVESTLRLTTVLLPLLESTLRLAALLSFLLSTLRLRAALLLPFLSTLRLAALLSWEHPVGEFDQRLLLPSTLRLAALLFFLLSTLRLRAALLLCKALRSRKLRPGGRLEHRRAAAAFLLNRRGALARSFRRGRDLRVSSTGLLFFRLLALVSVVLRLGPRKP
jgi:hypothetical protein